MSSFQVCKRPLKWMIGVVVIIVIYFFYMVNLNKRKGSAHAYDEVSTADFMNKKVFSVPWNSNCCSWWPVSHFILYAILGFLFPDCFWWLMLFGVIWECMESVAAMMTNGKRQKLITNEGVQYADSWFQGSVSDVFFNAAGFGAGFLLYKLVNSSSQ